MTAAAEATLLETLENEKLSLILALYESMLALSDLITEDGVESAAPYLSRQRDLTGQIEKLNQEIRRLPAPRPEERDRLDSVIKKQRAVLSETARLNQEFIRRGKDLKERFSEKIRGANRAKNISRRYYSGIQHPGFLLDYREV